MIFRILIPTLVVLASCQTMPDDDAAFQSHEPETSSLSEESDYSFHEVLREDFVMMDIPSTAQLSISPSAAGFQDPALIRKGRITFRTANPDKTAVRIDSLCRAFGAYAADQSRKQLNTGISFAMTLRVPDSLFDAFMADVCRSTQHIEEKNVNIQDVTEEYVDLKGRLTSKRETEKRYQALGMKAKTVEELIAIEKELDEIRGEIESMQGRLNYLQNRTAFSALHVVFYKIEKTSINSGNQLVQAIAIGWNQFVQIFVGLLTLWPFVILVGLAGYFLIRHQLRKGSAVSQHTPVPQTPGVP